MKLFSFILSVYVLLLTAVPCNDSHNDCTEEKIEICQSSDLIYLDHCSPFCTCECCASPLITIANPVHLSAFAFVQDIYVFELIDHIPPARTSVWQPPK